MSVCDGSSVLELQAEPVEAAMPASRSDRTIASPSTASKRKWALLGSLSVGWPLRCESGISARTRSTSRSRIALMRATSAGISAAMMSAAAAMPAIARHVLGARAEAALLAAAEQHRRDGDALAHVQRAEAARAVDVVRRERSAGRPAPRSRRSARRPSAATASECSTMPVPREQLGDLVDRLDGADLVARPADRDEDRVVGDAGAQLLGATRARTGRSAARVTRKPFFSRYLAMLRIEMCSASVMMTWSPLRRLRMRVADQREVVRLGGARGEDDLGGLGADEAGDAGAGVLEGRRGRVADAVQRRGVAEGLAEVRQHRLDDPRVDGLGRLVVGVDDAATVVDVAVIVAPASEPHRGAGVEREVVERRGADDLDAVDQLDASPSRASAWRPRRRTR